MLVESIGPDREEASVWRLPWFTVAVAAVVSALGLWLFWDGLRIMWSQWLYTPEYTHAILIPVVAGFLIWQQKDRLEQIPFEGSWWGVGIVVLGGGLLVLGQLATI